MYGVKKPRIAYQKGDFIDYTLMILISAAIICMAYGLRHSVSMVGIALCGFMVAVFGLRHGVQFKMPVLLRRPQDAIYMIVYKLRNLKPTYFLAIGALLLENYFIYLTPDLPHHVDLMRKVAIYLFFTHLIGITLYRTVVLVDHLRKKELVREFLQQTSWKKVISGRSNITLEILHAYFTGILTHIVLLAPWYLVITHLQFSVLALPLIMPINIVLQMRFFRTFGEWFYRDHWLGHNSELEFVYLHGTHHDAIPSGLIGVAGNGYLEGFLRHTMGYLTPFFSPGIAFLSYSFAIKKDIDFHQYIPGIFPKLPRKMHEITQHSLHHMGRLEPYGIGLKFDQPHLSEEFKKATRVPGAIRNSIRLDEQLTDYQWNTDRYRKYLALIDKYQQVSLRPHPEAESREAKH